HLDPLKQQGRFILSSHPEGKGKIYANSPYRLYEDDTEIQKGLSDEKGLVLYDYESGKNYYLKTPNGNLFEVIPQEVPMDKDEVLAQSISKMGHRYYGYESEDRPSHLETRTKQLHSHFLKKSDKPIKK
ncbi:MAG: hypothetical protein ACRCWR_10775, partial [Saezia sp.]